MAPGTSSADASKLEAASQAVPHAIAEHRELRRQLISNAA
jgi:hypothetical protein